MLQRFLELKTCFLSLPPAGLHSASWGLIECLFLFFFQYLKMGKSTLVKGFPGGSNSKESAGSAWDLDCSINSIPGLGRSLGEGNGYPLPYSCLENSMDRGPWWATVHGVIKNWIWMSNWARTLSKMLSVLHEPAFLLSELYTYHLFLEFLINSFV